jgi:hypothetical protein
MPFWPPQPYAPPVLSLTAFQALTALREFLLPVVSSGTSVIRAQVNRVPEPVGSNFVVMTLLFQKRLSTNDTFYYDNVITASIATTVLTVTAIPRAQSPLSTGMLLLDSGWPMMNLAAGTILGMQLTGAVGGVGTYAVSPSQTVASETMYAGVRADLTPVELTVQLDVHGPASSDNVRIIETLFRSEYGTASFSASGYDIQPLYCSDAHQMPFINAEQQYEDRWTMDAVMQMNPVIKTPEQFATQVIVRPIEAGVIYTGP